MVNGSLMGRTVLHLKIEEFLVPFFTSTIQWKLLIPIIKECIKGKYERIDKKKIRSSRRLLEELQIIVMLEVWIKVLFSSYSYPR